MHYQWCYGTFPTLDQPVESIQKQHRNDLTLQAYQLIA